MSKKPNMWSKGYHQRQADKQREIEQATQSRYRKSRRSPAPAAFAPPESRRQGQHDIELAFTEAQSAAYKLLWLEEKKACQAAKAEVLRLERANARSWLGFRIGVTMGSVVVLAVIYVSQLLT